MRPSDAWLGAESGEAFRRLGAVRTRPHPTHAPADSAPTHPAHPPTADETNCCASMTCRHTKSCEVCQASVRRLTVLRGVLFVAAGLAAAAGAGVAAAVASGAAGGGQWPAGAVSTTGYSFLARILPRVPLSACMSSRPLLAHSVLAGELYASFSRLTALMLFLRNTCRRRESSRSSASGSTASAASTSYMSSPTRTTTRMERARGERCASRRVVLKRLSALW